MLWLVLLLLRGPVVDVEHLLVYVTIVVVIASKHDIGKLEGVRPLDAAVAYSFLPELHADALLLKLQLLLLGERRQLLLVHHHHRLVRRVLLILVLLAAVLMELLLLILNSQPFRWIGWN